jgi:hypothetical protein|nr:hypothetical protein [Neorhizobium tomejilense]
MTATIRDIIGDIASRHGDRMTNDPKYRMTYELMRQASAPREQDRRYDRDGYCDNPARGY